METTLDNPMGTLLPVTLSALPVQAAAEGAGTALAPFPGTDPITLLLANKRSPATRRAYAGDVADFFGGPPSPEQRDAFLALPAEGVAQRLSEYKAAMLVRGLSEATVNRRLSALKSLLKFCHRMGRANTDGRGLVDGEKAKSYRDTRGVDLATMKQLLSLPARLHGAETVRGLRDTALLRLLCENALRRAEVCALDVRDFSLSGRRLLIIGKGRGTQKAPVTISHKCAESIALYLVTAGHAADEGTPLFLNLDRRGTRDAGHEGGRLTPDGLHDLVGRYGKALGTPLAPHKLRHSSITAALDATGGDVRRVQKLSRHADLRTLTIYDDNRTDLQGDVTGLLSGLL